eukprot:gb/GECH01010116.1/.p1 GENE.gb/GECH01010116.1/~~gb/GECH01010116.1/.p1  ORF type:complete len:324 (+),score=46.72 gb/GECH01010116.1/:1-972(+)
MDLRSHFVEDPVVAQYLSAGPSATKPVRRTLPKSDPHPHPHPRPHCHDRRGSGRPPTSRSPHLTGPSTTEHQAVAPQPRSSKYASQVIADALRHAEQRVQAKRTRGEHHLGSCSPDTMDAGVQLRSPGWSGHGTIEWDDGMGWRRTGCHIPCTYSTYWHRAIERLDPVRLRMLSSVRTALIRRLRQFTSHNTALYSKVRSLSKQVIYHQHKASERQHHNSCVAHVVAVPNEGFQVHMMEEVLQRTMMKLFVRFLHFSVTQLHPELDHRIHFMETAMQDLLLRGAFEALHRYTQASKKMSAAARRIERRRKIREVCNPYSPSPN